MESALDEILEKFEQLPFVGPKNASRIVYYLLKNERKSLQDMRDALDMIEHHLFFCTQCGGFTKHDGLCHLCSERASNSSLCLVQSPFDLEKLESVRSFKGLYWVLHGKLNPVDGIMPRHIRIEPLLKFLRGASSNISKMIFAFPWDIESEATIRYLIDSLHSEFPDIRFFRIPLGTENASEIRYLDDASLSSCMENLYEVKGHV